MEQKVIVVVKIVVPKEKEEHFLNAMKLYMEESKKEAGCMRFDLVESDLKPLEFWLLEEWKDNEACA